MQNMQIMQNVQICYRKARMCRILHSESTFKIGSLCNPTVTPSSKVVIPVPINYLAFVSLVGI